MVKIKIILVVLVTIALTSYKESQNCKGYLEVTFYSKGKKIMSVETENTYSIKLPIETRDIETGRALYSDSLSIRVLK